MKETLHLLSVPRIRDVIQSSRSESLATATKESNR